MIKNIVEDNNNITIESIHKQKLTELISKFQDSNNNFDLENFIKFLNDEKVKVIREGYSLSFLGKRAAELQSALDSTTVFVPDKEHNSKPENKDSENIYISADNLEALRHLKKSYHNKIKCIYIDPPYNTGNDGFCYVDKFKYDKDELANKLGIDVTEAERILNMESSKSNSHSAWLSFMYARLLIAYELLDNDKGVIFISISDKECFDLKLLCDEVFGEYNFLTDIIWNSTKSVTNTALLSNSHTHNLVYFKNKNYYTQNRTEFRLNDTGQGFENPDNDPRGPWKADPFQVGGYRPNQQYEIINPNTGEVYKPNEGSSWKNDYNKFQQLVADNRIVFGVNGTAGPQRKRFQSEAEERGSVATSIWIEDDTWIEIETTTNGTDQLKQLFDNKKVFSNPKPIGFIEKILQLTVEEDDVVLDFFSGSATTSHAVILHNSMNIDKRIKWIAVQFAENLDITLLTSNDDNKAVIENDISVCDKCGYPHTLDYVGIERIKRAAKKIKDETHADIDYGFKHYTLIDKKDTLDTLEKFDSNFAVLTQDEILNEFSIESRLITFLCDDGFGLNAKYEKIDIAGYKCFLIDGFLYLLDKGFDSSQIASLIEKIDKKEIALRKIVIFGYAFDTRCLQQLKDNAEKLGIADNKDIIVKY